VRRLKAAWPQAFWRAQADLEKAATAVYRRTYNWSLAESQRYPDDKKVAYGVDDEQETLL
jgi:hypothetical protein